MPEAVVLFVELSIQFQNSPIAAPPRSEMALRIEKAFGVKMDTLMRMWSAYEIAQTRKWEKRIRVRRALRAA